MYKAGRSRGKNIHRTKFVVLGVILLLLAGGWFYTREHYTVETVHVQGNVHYTEEEIKAFVMEGPLGDNSLYLSLKYRNKGVENIPFVDVMDVEILSADSIQITVYEKALAGYIRYMDAYMYFDKDGYVVECSDKITEGVPQISGLTFSSMVLGERLPVEDPAVFDSIMELTKLLEKNELNAERIFFASSGDITLYFGDIKAALGNERNHLEAKLSRIKSILPTLEGKKGILRMENVTEDNTAFTLQLEES